MWLLDVCGVVYLFVCDWLVVFDLYLEKGSYLCSYVNLLLSLDFIVMLMWLESIIEDYKLLWVISLGDSFYDKYSMLCMIIEDC